MPSRSSRLCLVRMIVCVATSLTDPEPSACLGLAALLSTEVCCLVRWLIDARPAAQSTVILGLIRLPLPAARQARRRSAHCRGVHRWQRGAGPVL